MGKNAAASKFSVPKWTHKDRLSGRVEHGNKPGLAPYLLTDDEEHNCQVNNSNHSSVIKSMTHGGSSSGASVSFKTHISSAQSVVKMTTPSNNVAVNPPNDLTSTVVTLLLFI